MSTASLNHRLIADRVLCHRDDLRSIPGNLQSAVELARAMILERELFDPGDRATYNTNRGLDALLAMIEGTALYLSHRVADVIGEDDSDLPMRQ